MDPNLTVSTYYGRYHPSFTNGFNCHIFSPDVSSMDVPFVSPIPKPAAFSPSFSFSSTEEVLCWSREGDASSQNDGTEPSDPALKYITQILMEEDNEYMLREDKDQLALRDTELSLYQALGEEYSPPFNQIVESPIVGDRDHNPSLLQVPLPSGPHCESNSNFSFHSTTFTGNMGDGLMLQNMLNGVKSSSQFKKGYEDACKFIPNIDLESNNLATNLNGGNRNAISNEDTIEREQPTDGSRRRKNQDRKERDLEEERSTKKSAMFAEESELTELFDKILLFDSKPAKDEAVKCGTLETNKRPAASKGGKMRNKRQVKEDPIDVKDLLIPCARAVFYSDHRSSGQLLKQIRKYASPFGDGSQRLAHYFANALEARMSGSGTKIQNTHRTLASMHTTCADVMKAINCAYTALPYELPIRYANKIICKMAENAKALHIVDFGVSFGFQWPNLIELLSVRDGGPPKLRFTGIEFPQQGFRPAARAEETGNFLARYCERFNVPFEFESIALKDWETLQPEKLKIDRDEMVVANNLYRFESLLDETDDVECPRDAVLRIVMSMNPDIFVHSVINGSFNGPYFVTRFREALFCYSSMFDAHNDVGPEDLAWLMYESHYYGPEIMNVVACEGSERIFRPESYKQWQVRNLRAGFKPVPLDRDLMQGLKEQLKTRKHKDFALDEDGPWTLQGWKGRITHAWSFWVCATPHL